MKNFKLKKLVAVALTAITIATVSPIGASAAWKQDSNGWWNTEGNSWSIGWKTIDNSWYYFGSDGYMKTGWINDGGKWYYTASSGAMQTGWLSNNGAWYYLNTSGAMQTGLVDVNSKTYYLSDSGSMQTGNITINGTSYTFATNGEKITTTNTTVANTTAQGTNETTVASGSSSGGSGGSSSSTSHPYYDSLYGTWTIAKSIPSKITETLSTTYGFPLSSYVGQEVIIDSNKISVSIKTISNPTIKEGTMTSSEFSSKYNDTLKNIGISGDKVNYVHISSGSNYVDIFIADDNTVYTLVKGALFKLEK